MLQELLTRPLKSQPSVALALAARLIIILIMLAFSVMIIRGLYFSNQGWVEVKARVVANEEHSSNPTLYTPIYTYFFNGQEYARRAGTIARDKQYVIDGEVPILVNTDNPAEVKQLKETRLGTLLLLGVILIPCMMMTVRTIVEVERLLKS